MVSAVSPYQTVERLLAFAQSGVTEAAQIDDCFANSMALYRNSFLGAVSGYHSVIEPFSGGDKMVWTTVETEVVDLLQAFRIELQKGQTIWQVTRYYNYDQSSPQNLKSAIANASSHGDLKGFLGCFTRDFRFNGLPIGADNVFGRLLLNQAMNHGYVIFDRSPDAIEHPSDDKCTFRFNNIEVVSYVEMVMVKEGNKWKLESTATGFRPFF